MSGFTQSATGAPSATFSAEEARILSDLVGQLADLVQNRGVSGSDPALDRLLPVGYRNSDEDAAEFRRFTESDLADAKVRNARTVLADLSSDARHRKRVVELGREGLGAWLRTLTDLRLTLGARLGVQRDGTIPDGADAMTIAIYDWLGYLQETLVDSADQ